MRVNEQLVPFILADLCVDVPCEARFVAHTHDVQLRQNLFVIQVQRIGESGELALRIAGASLYERRGDGASCVLESTCDALLFIQRRPELHLLPCDEEAFANVEDFAAVVNHHLDVAFKYFDLSDDLRVVKEGSPLIVVFFLKLEVINFRFGEREKFSLPFEEFACDCYPERPTPARKATLRQQRYFSARPLR